MVHLAPGGEWTVEANPGTLDAEKADVLAEAGVNRVSLGAQSFQPELLRVLERHHGRAEVEQAVEIVRPRFARWSLDLIFGVPGSTTRRLADRPRDRPRLRARRTSRATGWSSRRGPRSGTSGTAGWSSPLDEETERLDVRDRRSSGWQTAGLAMYEISNFARPGHESRHNLVYWANDAYFGFGVGAARYLRGVRSVNTRDLTAVPAAGRSRRAGDRAERRTVGRKRGRARPRS